MKKWNSEIVGRLHELHRQLVAELTRSVVAANVSLGSAEPNRTKLKHLTRAEFEAVLEGGGRDPKAIHAWVRRIIRGHEHEFPTLQATG